jgi:multiple sugar transport system ATP-binding protein
MAEIRFESVRKSFGDEQVIKGLSLVIRDGEFFTFVGPSGCGKSTILNMIAGLEVVSGGELWFDSVKVTGLPPGQRDVAMVFQSYALYPHMTVRENIGFPLKMKKASRAEREKEAERVATLLGLSSMLEKRPMELSGGQRQRVALGRAIVRRPRAFLMDEPLSNLDARLRIEMRAEIKKLHRELKVTTVYVTHDQAEALGMSQRIAVLEGGEIRQCGTPAEVYTRPSNVFVAGFIGSPPMNFFNADVVEGSPFTVAVNNVRFTPRLEKDPGVGSVTLGIRPDDLMVSTEGHLGEGDIGEGGAGTVKGVAAITEPEGPVEWVAADWDGGEPRARRRGILDDPRGEAPRLRPPDGGEALRLENEGRRRVTSPPECGFMKLPVE